MVAISFYKITFHDHPCNIPKHCTSENTYVHFFFLGNNEFSCPVWRLQLVKRVGGGQCWRRVVMPLDKRLMCASKLGLSQHCSIHNPCVKAELPVSDLVSNKTSDGNKQ